MHPTDERWIDWKVKTLGIPREKLEALIKEYSDLMRKHIDNPDEEGRLRAWWDQHQREAWSRLHPFEPMPDMWGIGNMPYARMGWMARAMEATEEQYLAIGTRIKLQHLGVEISNDP